MHVYIFFEFKKEKNDYNYFYLRVNIIMFIDKFKYGNNNYI